MFKKLIFLFISSALLVLFSCTKTTSAGGCRLVESTAVAPSTEIAALQSWITANHPAAVQHTSGLFYEISSAGTGGSATICSTVLIKYTGTLISPSPGFKFDENLTGTTFTLGNLIAGWQKGIPLIKAGGSINLYIPPTLGYGASGSGAVPPNAYLAFSIQLVNVY